MKFQPDKKYLLFISSKQIELQAERNGVRDMIVKDVSLSKMFLAKTFEHDLSGRKESVSMIIEEWVLKSDVYLGVFDKKFSEAVEQEYRIAINDKSVKKEIMIFVRKRNRAEREAELNKLLDKIMDVHKGHSCVEYLSLKDLVDKVKTSLINYVFRQKEGFIISRDVLGLNLEAADHTDFPEKFRRALLQPTIGRYMIPRGKKGIPEYYRYNENGEKIDVTWDSIEPNVSKEIKEYYRQRYKKPFEEKNR